MHIKILRILLSLSLLLSPFTAIAEGGVSVGDLIAGLGGEAAVSGMPAKESLTLKLMSPAGKTVSLPFTTNTSGSAKVALPGESLTQAGSYELSVVKNGVLAETTVKVLPEKIDIQRSRVEAMPLEIAPDGQDEATVVVTLVDRYGNPLSGRPVELISSRSSDVIAALNGETDAKGKQRFSFRTKKMGTASLRAFDLLSSQTLTATAKVTAGNDIANSVGSDEPSDYQEDNDSPYSAQLIEDASAASPTFGALAGFQISVTPGNLEVSDFGNVRVKAVDREGNTVEDFVGSITMKDTTDPTGTILPGINENGTTGSVTFTPKNLGERYIPLSIQFSSPGEHTLRVEDRSDPLRVYSGEVDVSVTGSPVINAANHIEITSHTQDDYVSSTTITLEGIGPKYTELIIQGGLEDTDTETDGGGKFSQMLKLPANQNEFTLRVKDRTGKYDSGNLHLIFDGTPPAVKNISVTPEKPQADANAVVTVETEKGSTVTMDLKDETFILVESATKAGIFQTSFPVPDEAGKQQVSVTVADIAGNTTVVLASFTVMAKELPAVQNAKGEGVQNGVKLSWDPVLDQPIKNYNVYVGEDPLDLKVIATKDDTPAAIVSQLEGGKEYYFAITAVEGEREGPMSDPFIVRTKGISFKAEPRDGGLALSWTDLSEDESVSAFRLRYGVDSTKLSESRLINGKLSSFVLSDLYNGITYYLDITPITTSNEYLEDQTAKTSGKPSSDISGFHPSPGETLPFDPDLLPPDNGLHESAPSTTSSGIPSFAWMIAGAVALGAGFFQWHRRRSMKMTVSFLQAMDHVYRH